ncbi:MAG: AAA family ATPase, partial [Desulfovibrionaceae bacterium]|nr:AAA family ATPase [Desulfovibrionaceae bacterium]
MTLLTRPRRFGKTLMLDTVNTFFSPKFADRSDLF